MTAVIGRYRARRLLTLLLAALCLFSAVMTGTTAWTDLAQHRTNALFGRYIPGAGTGPGLLITKTVVNADGSGLTAEQETTALIFTVTFGDGGSYPYSVDGATEQTLLRSGETLPLRHDQAAYFDSLPEGLLYTVTEAPAPDCAVSSVNNQGTVTEKLTIAAFTNTYGTETAFRGLRILKTVVNADGTNLTDEQRALEFEFEISFEGDGAPEPRIQSFTLAHGEETTFENLPAGVRYTVRDTVQPGYTAAVWEYTGETAEGGTLLPFLNVYNAEPEGEGALEISKTVTGSPADGAPAPEFIFTVVWDGWEEDGEPVGPVTVVLTDGQTERIAHIPAGVRYRVTETPADGYTAAVYSAEGEIVSGQTAQIPFRNLAPLPDETTLRGEKIWDLSGAPAGIVLPESVTVYLKSGEVTVDSVTVRPDQDGKWLYAFTAPRFDAEGNAIRYTVDEENVPDYLKAITGNQDAGFVITNIYVEIYSDENIRLAGEKVWVHGTNPASRQPAQVTVYAIDGSRIVQQQTLTAADNWQWSFTLPRFDAEGNEIRYTVDEAAVPGYIKTVTGSLSGGFVITNKYDESDDGGDTVTVSGQKLWLCGSDPVSQRPAGITVYVKNGDFVVWQKVVTGAAGWRWSVALPRYDSAGEEIPYTVDEAEPPGYTKTVTGSLRNGFVIANTYKGAPDDQTVLITGKKTWVHGSNAEAKRPGQITVLVRNGSYVAAQRVITSADNWQWSFELPKYDSSGEELRYTVEELAVPGYAKTVSGYDIGNRFVSGGYPGDSPKTGDSGNFWLWTALMAVSLAALSVVRCRSRQRRP
jgi:V8-like Glu-specific endopeptidase